MATNMIPCLNPKMCGVRSHRPGTTAPCMKDKVGQKWGVGDRRVVTTKGGLVAPVSHAAKREDIHRPSSPDFDPEKYRFPGGITVFDSNSDMGDLREFSGFMASQGYTLGSGSAGTCGHCGSNMRYSVPVVRDDVKEYIFVGEDCAANTFSATFPEFKKAREDAAALRAQQLVKAEFSKTLEEHPELAVLTYPEMLDSEFALSLRHKLYRSGSLSQQQIDAFITSQAKDLEYIEREKEREAKRAQMIANGVKVPAGTKVAIAGKVTTVRFQDSQYGGAYKMRVESPEGWSVWGTVPSALNELRKDNRLVGSEISFTASEVKGSDSDQTFGFFSRPSKTQVTNEVPPADLLVTPEQTRDTA